MNKNFKIHFFIQKRKLCRSDWTRYSKTYWRRFKTCCKRFWKWKFIKNFFGKYWDDIKDRYEHAKTLSNVDYIDSDKRVVVFGIEEEKDLKSYNIRSKSDSIRGKGFYKNAIEYIISKSASENPLTLAYAYKYNDSELLLAHLFIGEYKKLLTDNDMFINGKLNHSIDYIGDSVMTRRALWFTKRIENPTIADAIVDASLNKNGNNISFSQVQYTSMYKKVGNEYIVNKPVDEKILEKAIIASKAYLKKPIEQIAVTPYFLNPVTSTNKIFQESLEKGKTKLTLVSDTDESIKLTFTLGAVKLKNKSQHDYYGAKIDIKKPFSKVNFSKELLSYKKDIIDMFHEGENIKLGIQDEINKNKISTKKGDIILSLADVQDIQQKLNKIAKNKQQEILKN